MKVLTQSFSTTNKRLRLMSMGVSERSQTHPRFRSFNPREGYNFSQLVTLDKEKNMSKYPYDQYAPNVVILGHDISFSQRLPRYHSCQYYYVLPKIIDKNCSMSSPQPLQPVRSVNLKCEQLSSAPWKQKRSRQKKQGQNLTQSRCPQPLRPLPQLSQL